MVSKARSEYSSQWAAITSIASKIGCTSEMLRPWVSQQETNAGQRPSLTSAEQERMKALEREIRELHEVNEILLGERDEALSVDIERVWQVNLQVHGAEKVWGAAAP